jgi:hypothetical protein
LACVESSDTISEAALTAVRHLRPTKEMERGQGKIAHMHRTMAQRRKDDVVVVDVYFRASLTDSLCRQ